MFAVRNILLFWKRVRQRLAETAQKGRHPVCFGRTICRMPAICAPCLGRILILKLQPDPSIRIGGLRADLPEQSLRLDDTLDARLENQREWFMEHSGLTIGDA